MREVTKWPPHRFWFLEWRFRAFMMDTSWRLDALAKWFRKVGSNRPSITGAI